MSGQPGQRRQPQQGTQGRSGQGAQPGATAQPSAAQSGAAQPSAAQSGAAQSGAAAQPSAAAATQPAAPAQSTAAARPAPSTTPRLLRFARAAAAAAALLTGVAATGTFSTDGVSATPNVVVQQWTAAERAGVLIAETEQLGAARVAGGDSADTREAYDAAAAGAGRDLGELGADAGDASADWTSFVVGAERAASTAQTDRSAAAEDFGAAAESARAAAQQVGEVADQRVSELGTGTSVVTATVGTAATLVLLGIMVALALRTRRIINVPLLLATAITAGLTYLSVNPSVLPLDYDQQLSETAATATALQQVQQARAAQYAESLGISSTWQDEAQEATTAVADVAEEQPSDAWADTWAQVSGTAPDDAGLQESQASFADLTQRLEDRLEEQLDSLSSEVGAPALITAGAALLLGVAASVLAWTGISRRLRDYR